MFAEGPFDFPLDVGPGWGVYPEARHGCSLGPEEVLVPHDAADRGVDFWMVVDEVGEVLGPGDAAVLKLHDGFADGQPGGLAILARSLKLRAMFRRPGDGTGGR